MCMKCHKITTKWHFSHWIEVKGEKKKIVVIIYIWCSWSIFSYFFLILSCRNEWKLGWIEALQTLWLCSRNKLWIIMTESFHIQTSWGAVHLPSALFRRWCWDDATRGGGRGWSGRCQQQRGADIRNRCCCCCCCLPSQSVEERIDSGRRTTLTGHELTHQTGELGQPQVWIFDQFMTQCCVFTGYANIGRISVALLAALAFLLFTDS